MNTQNINNPQPPVQQEAEWQGYTFEQLRFERALALIKLENEKSVLTQKVNKQMESFKTTTSAVSVSSGILKQVMGRMKWMDYALIAYNIAKFAMRFRRR